MRAFQNGGYAVEPPNPDVDKVNFELRIVFHDAAQPIRWTTPRPFLAPGLKCSPNPDRNRDRFGGVILDWTFLRGYAKNPNLNMAVRKYSSLMDGRKYGAKRMHPTQKPVQLMSWVKFQQRYQKRHRNCAGKAF